MTALTEIEASELKRDAERYRFIRDYLFVEAYWLDEHGRCGDTMGCSGTGRSLDTAVDFQIKSLGDVNPAEAGTRCSRCGERTDHYPDGAFHRCVTR